MFMAACHSDINDMHRCDVILRGDHGLKLMDGMAWARVKARVFGMDGGAAMSPKLEKMKCMPLEVVYMTFIHGVSAHTFSTVA